MKRHEHSPETGTNAKVVDLHNWIVENRPGVFFGLRGSVFDEQYLPGDGGEDKELRDVIAEQRRARMHIAQPGEREQYPFATAGAQLDVIIARQQLDAQADTAHLDREAAKEAAYAARSAAQAPPPDIFVLPPRES